MSHFLAMGGYAVYVWPAYGISLIGLVAAVVSTLHAYGRAKASLAALEGRKP